MLVSLDFFRTIIDRIVDDLKTTKDKLQVLQPKITGQSGQVVGFDADGNVVATDKPSYTAQEVGALPATTAIPSTAADVNAEPIGAVSQHNASDAAHSDIRLLIRGLSERLSAVADSDHANLKNRDAANQHPMSAITGLQAALEGKQAAGNYLTDKDLDATLTVRGKASDAKAVGDALSALSEEKVNLPKDVDGNLLTPTDGQTLLFKADGTTYYGTPTISGGDSSNENVEDILLGTLPYTVTENGCYLLSDTNATISTCTGAEQLLDFEANTNFSLPLPAYCHAIYEIKGKNTVNVGFEDLDGHAAVNFDTNNVQPNTTYTMFAKYESDYDLQEITPFIRLRNSSVQLNLNKGVFALKTFTTGDDSSIGPSAYIQLPRSGSSVSITDINTNIDVTIYLFQGELTEMPSGTSFDILANTKYDLDAYIGSTLSTVNGETVRVYKVNTSQSENETDINGVIFFGDSIFDYSDVPTRYAEKTGKSVLDCAIGGTRMSGGRDSTNEYYPYDMTNIADAIASGDFSAQINGGKNSNFSVLSSGNISNYKAIILEFGTNDFTAGASFNGADVTSIEGAVKHILTTILTKYPNIRIVVLSTLQFVTIGTGTESGVPTHADGTVWEMNEVIKEICESDEYCVPFVDMYHKFGENGITRNTLTSDGVHLMSPNGSKRYADILTGQLNALGI